MADRPGHPHRQRPDRLRAYRRAAGETTYIGIYPDLGWVAVILSNYDSSNQVGSLIQLQDQLIAQHAAL